MTPKQRKSSQTFPNSARTVAFPKERQFSEQFSKRLALSGTLCCECSPPPPSRGALLCFWRPRRGNHAKPLQTLPGAFPKEKRFLEQFSRRLALSGTLCCECPPQGSDKHCFCVCLTPCSDPQMHAPPTHSYPAAIFRMLKQHYHMQEGSAADGGAVKDRRPRTPG